MPWPYRSFAVGVSHFLLLHHRYRHGDMKHTQGAIGTEVSMHAMYYAYSYSYLVTDHDIQYCVMHVWLIYSSCTSYNIAVYNSQTF